MDSNTSISYKNFLLLYLQGNELRSGHWRCVLVDKDYARTIR